MSGVLKVQVTYGDLYDREGERFSDKPWNLVGLSKGYFKVEDLSLSTPCEASMGGLDIEPSLVELYKPQYFKMDVHEIEIKNTLDYDSNNGYKYIDKEFLHMSIPVPPDFLGGCNVDFKVVGSSGKEYSVNVKASS